MGFWEFFFGIKPGSKSPVNVKKEVIGVCLGNFVGDAPIMGPILTIIDGVGSGIELAKLVKKRIKQWEDAGLRPTRPDPLVLDLNRDGKVELKNTAFFDLNANGFHEFTRWIDKTDAFLVLDKNFNGKADNGGELFGDAMTLPDGSLALTGFDALRAYDSNGDGKIDASDEIYASLKVLTGEGKMSSLTDAGIKSLNCPPSPASPSLPSTPPIQPPDAAVIGGGGSSGGSSGGMISIGGPISGGGTTTTPSADPWASLTWEERILALKDQAREADRALWESGGSIALYICASF